VRAEPKSKVGGGGYERGGGRGGTAAPSMYALYLCLTCMSYMYVLGVCLICMPYMYALYVCL